MVRRHGEAPGLPAPALAYMPHTLRHGMETMTGVPLRLAVVLVVVLAVVGPAAAVPIKTGTDSKGRSYALGQVLVKLRPPSETEVSAASTSLLPGLRLSHTFDAGRGGATVMSAGASEPMRLYTLEDRTQNVEETVKKLRALPGVEWASPNYVKRLYTPVSGESAEDAASNKEEEASQGQGAVRKLSATAKTAKRIASLQVNDELYGQQWHLGQIDAPGAWAYSQGSRTSKLCIIDSGMQKGHPDLPTPLKGWSTRAITDDLGYLTSSGLPERGTPEFSDYNDKKPPDSCGPLCSGGHGTHVAGIAAALGNNTRGVAGIAYKAGLMVCRVLDADDESVLLTSSLYRCIDLCIADGAKVISMSIGGPRTSDEDKEAFMKTTRAGVLLVVAAGNDKRSFVKSPIDEWDFPAGFAAPAFKMDNVITVAALSRSGMLASYSNHGPNVVQIAAPGYALSTYPDSTYQVQSGTSMATPMVSAAAALLFAAAEARGKRVTYLDVKKALLGSVDPFPDGNKYVSTGGKLNVARAVRRLLLGTSAAPPPPPSPSAATSTVVIERYPGQRWKHFTDSASYFNQLLVPYAQCVKTCSDDIKCGKYVAFRESPVVFEKQNVNCLLWSADAELCISSECAATLDSPDVESGLVIRRPVAGYDAWQSSTDTTAAAALAVDGTSSTFSSTLPQANPWLVVDLRQAQEISAVRIIVRRDAAYIPGTLHDLEVRLGTAAPARQRAIRTKTRAAAVAPTNLGTLNVRCGIISGQVGTRPGEPIVMVCQRPTVARYITLQIRGRRTDDVLTVAEVMPAW